MKPVVEVAGLTIEFPAAGRPATVAYNIDFEVAAGECLAIVGESGSGKSMTCLALLGMVPAPGRVTAQRIAIDGRDIQTLSAAEMRKLRGDHAAMVFQDPSASLNPLFTVERQIVDVIHAHRRWSKEKVRARVIEVLDAVGFPDASRRMKAYPHELSGGLRQRVAIAMALACEPRVLVADEPTTNLDVSIQAQIIDLIGALKRDMQLGVVFVTHDLALAGAIADRVMVMYAGHAVERGETSAVLERPAHPYTVGLLHSAPQGTSHRAQRLTPIPGTVPDLRTTVGHSPFVSRCPVAVAGVCEVTAAGWTSSGESHEVCCHRFERDGREGTVWV